jgi:cytochrome c-type biogenesis protein CcmH/NrfG
MLDTASPHPRRRPASWLAAALATLLLAVTGLGWAQNFDADRYLAQCLRFEAGGDYTSAREACRNAMQVDPDRVDVQLALARIEIALGELATAENRLTSVDRQAPSAEASLLLARIALDEERYVDAEGRLSRAATLLEEQPDRALAARLAFLQGRLFEGQGRVRDALDAYGDAVALDGLEPTYRLAAAELRLLLGDPQAARAELESYQALADDPNDPRVRSLLGRVLWADGELDAAAGQLETALALWSNLDARQQGEDLRTLGLIYLGQGDVGRGSLALREAGRRGNQLALLGGNTLLWLLLLLGLLIVHLLAESRIESYSSLEVVEGPRPWTVANIYAIAVVAALAGLAGAVLTGVVLYDNLLSIVTPLQSNEAMAVALSVFALVSTLLVMRAVRERGWALGPRLIGTVDTWAAGVGVGAGMLVVTLGYLAVRPASPFLPTLWLDLAYVTPIVAAAALFLPLSEFLFRPFAYDALEYRYGMPSALIISGGVSALVLATPIVLLLPFGVLLAELYRRSRSGILVLSAQLTLNVGLVVAVLVSPWVRSLFL